jgi:hypothetical protein
MSHRLCLYTTDAPPHAGDGDPVMLFEVAYQIPALLVPLLASGGKIGPVLGATDDRNDDGLYFDASAGIARLRRFYDLIAASPEAIADRTAFDADRAELFAYLDGLDKPCFHLDLRDVFTMLDTPHDKQARDALADLTRQNALIAAAIKAGDLTLLDTPEAADLRGGLPTFADLLADGANRHGWGWFDAAPAAWREAPEPFEENGRWGLRDAAGSVLAAATYDAVYEPGPLDRVVVMRGDRFGYLDVQGRLVIGLDWDDAYDFDWGGLAVVARAGKFGLIDIHGELSLAADFDDIDPIGDHGDYAVCLHGKWGVLDRTGACIVPCEHAAALEPLYADFFTLAKQKGVAASLLYHRRTGLLATGFTELIGEAECPNLLVVRDGKKFGGIGVEQAVMLLPVEYDHLVALPAVVERRTGNFMLVTQGKCKGVFDADPDTPGWRFPLDDWEDAISLDERRFALKRGGRWRLAGWAASSGELRGRQEAGTPADFDLIVRKPPFNGYAYAFHGEDVWIADDAGLYRADVEQVETDLDYSYGITFSREARRRLKAFCARPAGG